jgi:hypothetical protein
MPKPLTDSDLKEMERDAQVARDMFLEGTQRIEVARLSHNSLALIAALRDATMLLTDAQATVADSHAVRQLAPCYCVHCVAHHAERGIPIAEWTGKYVLWPVDEHGWLVATALFGHRFKVPRLDATQSSHECDLRTYRNMTSGTGRVRVYGDIAVIDMPPALPESSP